MELPQHTTTLPRWLWAVHVLRQTATLHGGNGQWSSYNTPPHWHAQWAVEFLQHTSCRIAWGQWVMELLLYTATLPRWQWAVNLLWNTNPRQCGGVLPVFHYPPPLGSAAVCCRSSTVHCLRKFGGVLQDFHCPLPPCSVAVFRRRSTAHRHLSSMALCCGSSTARCP